jgi:peptidoglycan/LPS O-acetylase OafA/YrhL
MTAWHRWAWVGVWLVSVPFGDADRGSWRAVAAVVVGAAVGAVWQATARRDVAERLTWLSGFALAFGLAFLLDAVVGTGGTGLEVGPTAYFVGVAAAVVVTERVLRRREVGPVTRDMVHAPEQVAGAGGHQPDAGRRAGA